MTETNKPEQNRQDTGNDARSRVHPSSTPVNPSAQKTNLLRRITRYFPHLLQGSAHPIQKSLDL